MSSHDRPIHDVLGCMSDDEGEDDVPDDLELTFVPKSERAKRVQHRQPRATLASSSPAAPTTAPAPEANTGSTVSSSASYAKWTPNKAETVYEQERNAKVRALLTDQHKAGQSVGGIFSMDMFEAAFEALPMPAHNQSAQSFSSSPFSASPQQPSNHGGRGDGGDGQRRYRMPHPNMSEEEHARYIRSRRNMAVTRNALREVDPETLEYTQVTQAADAPQASGSMGGRGGRGDAMMGRGGYGYRGRGLGQRGRGGGYYNNSGQNGGGEGRGRGHAHYNGGGRGGGAPFSPYRSQ